MFSMITSSLLHRSVPEDAAPKIESKKITRTRGRAEAKAKVKGKTAQVKMKDGVLLII
jgi:hypothetical protein